jgi:hypothetical protein
MQQIDLYRLREGYRGTRYADLIQHHLERQTPQQRAAAIRGTIQMLPLRIQPSIEGFIDRWNAKAYDQSFWESDTAAVFDEISADARELLARSALIADDETVFNVFNIITLSYASSAAGQPKMRAFMGIEGRSSFPIWSTLALLIPVAAFLRISNTPAELGVRFGYLLTQLGYVLFVAGVVTGTFRVFGLTSRRWVLSAAVVVFIMGTIMSNTGR